MFLNGWERTVLVVSHDRGFLNKATTATIFIHGKRLRYYGGNYDTFLKVRGRPMPSRGPSHRVPSLSRPIADRCAPSIARTSRRTRSRTSGASAT